MLGASATSSVDVGELTKAIALRGSRGPLQMQRVANCILTRPELIVFGSVATVSAATGVSPASLVRFCQIVGLTGFAQLREILRKELMDSLRINKASVFHPDASYKRTLQHVVGLNIKAMERLYSSLSEEAISDFIEVIERAHTIFIVGEGRFYPIALVLHHLLGKMRIRSNLATRDESATEDILAFAGYGDALVEIAATSSVAGAPTRLSACPIHHTIPSAGQEAQSRFSARQLILSDDGSTYGSLLALCHALTLCIESARSSTKHSPRGSAKSVGG